MNYMPKVLEMLGLEVEELFNIIGADCNPYLFDEEYNLLDAEYYIRNGFIRGLIIGKYEIEKLPYKPKSGDVYFIVKHEGTDLDRVGCIWVGDYIDYYCYNAGNCFRTAEEITDEIKKRILQEMKGKYEND